MQAKLTLINKKLARALLFLTIHLIMGCSFSNLDKELENNSTALTSLDAPLTPSANVLVFYKTSGYYHKSIPNGIKAIQKLGKENNFQVFATKGAENFKESILKKYDAVVFLSTTAEVLNANQQAAFEKYIRSGKGFVGIHSAADTEYNWSWYHKLLGAYFTNHPSVQKATIKIINKKHPATAFLPDNWKRTDEWYNFRNINPNIKVLANLDESSYKGGKNGKNHPFAWYHNFDGGRAFYTAGGHTPESYNEPLFLKHILGGIKYAIGEK